MQSGQTSSREREAQESFFSLPEESPSVSGTEGRGGESSDDDRADAAALARGDLGGEVLEGELADDDEKY